LFIFPNFENVRRRREAVFPLRWRRRRRRSERDNVAVSVEGDEERARDVDASSPLEEELRSQLGSKKLNGSVI
jgi:hypothetical protein